MPSHISDIGLLKVNLEDPATSEFSAKSLTKQCLLTPWSRVLLEKLTGSTASQEILRSFGT